jgi:glutamate racemase
VTLPRIGVFDSGVGGLTVLKAIAEQLPAHYIYFGDTARLPYGTKSAETVARYAIGATKFLEAQNIDLLVIACNTATALALPAIEAAANVPVVGVVEPGASMAAGISKNRAAIVIATEATVSSHAYRDALQHHGVQAHEKACPLFVPLVEEGWIEHPVTEQVARIYLDEAMLQAPPGADVLVLACTHYPLIAPLLRRILPASMEIVDSAESTAGVVRKMIAEDPTLSQLAVPALVSKSAGAASGSLERAGSALGFLNQTELASGSANLICHPERSEPQDERSRRTPIPGTTPTQHRTFRFYVTDSTEKFKRLATRFLGRQVDNVEHVDLENTKA